MLTIDIQDISSIDIDNIVRDVQDKILIRVVEIFKQAKRRILSSTIGKYLSGRSLNRVTGTLQHNIYVTDPHVEKDKSVIMYAGVSDGANPKNKTPAHVYGFMWEGQYPLPKHMSHVRYPRPFFVPGGIEDVKPWLISKLEEMSF